MSYQPILPFIASSGKIGFMTERRQRPFNDLVGQKFGYLKIIDKVIIPGKRGVSWKCKCDCGNECVAYGGHLRAKNRTSCGCKHEVNIEKTGCKILFNITKRKSEEKKREFSLTLEQFSKIIKQNCNYCGSPPSQEIKRMKSKKVQIIYNGIDRVDSSMGYITNNCVACCKFCNRSKSDLSLSSWKNHLLKTVKFMGLS